MLIKLIQVSSKIKYMYIINKIIIRKKQSHDCSFTTTINVPIFFKYSRLQTLRYFTTKYLPDTRTQLTKHIEVSFSQFGYYSPELFLSLSFLLNEKLQIRFRHQRLLSLVALTRFLTLIASVYQKNNGTSYFPALTIDSEWVCENWEPLWNSKCGAVIQPNKLTK